MRVSADVGAAAADSTVLLWTFDLGAGWHLYGPHRNDTGQPPTVAMDLPEGWDAGPLVGWPAPTRHVVADLILDHIYEDRLVLRQTLRHPPDRRPLEVTAKVRWLVCSELCVPGDTTMVLALPTRPAAATAAALAGQRAATPAALPAAWSASTPARRRGVSVPEARRLEFVLDAGGPAPSDLLHDGVARGVTLRLRLAVRPRSDPLTGLLIIDYDDRQVVAGSREAQNPGETMKTLLLHADLGRRGRRRPR